MSRTISKEMVNDAKLIFRIQHFIHCPYFTEYNISSILLSLTQSFFSCIVHQFFFSLWDSSDITLRWYYISNNSHVSIIATWSLVLRKILRLQLRLVERCYGQMVISDMNVGWGMPGFSGLSETKCHTGEFVST